MPEPSLPPLLFLAESRGVDFLNTRLTRRGKVLDALQDGDGLIRWLVEAGLVDRPVAQHMRLTVGADCLDRLAAEAREIREWFRGFVEARRGTPLLEAQESELRPLNALLSRDDAKLVVLPGPTEKGASSSGLRRSITRAWSSPASLLHPLGPVLADVVCDIDFRQIKRCEGARCSLLFVDSSKSQTRRWCSMAVCGNRAKQAARRRRTSA